jgi:hypothetical protein
MMSIPVSQEWSEQLAIKDIATLARVNHSQTVDEVAAAGISRGT